MFAYKKIFGATVLSLMSFPVFAAENCEPVPDCSAIGFAYTSAQCGSLKKLKCPFDDVHYFCSKSDCNQVTFNSTTQYCTKYCADTPSMCVEAAYKTCNTTYNTGLFASNNGVGTLHTANSTISSSSSNYITGTHYLLGPVTLSSGSYSGSNSGYFQNAYIYNAGLSYPNNCASSMSGTPKLSGYATLSGHNYFAVDVDFKNVYYTPSNRWGASFLGNTNLSIDYHPASIWANEITVDFEGRDYGSPTTNKLCIRLDNSGCQNTSWGEGNCVGTYRSELTVNIASYNANVKYYIQGGQSQYIHVNCGEYSSGGSCTEDYSACDYYY